MKGEDVSFLCSFPSKLMERAVSFSRERAYFWKRNIRHSLHTSESGLDPWTRRARQRIQNVIQSESIAFKSGTTRLRVYHENDFFDSRLSRIHDRVERRMDRISSLKMRTDCVKGKQNSPCWSLFWHVLQSSRSIHSLPGYDFERLCSCIPVFERRHLWEEES